MSGLSYRIIDGPPGIGRDVDVTEHVFDDTLTWAALGGMESAAVSLDLSSSDLPNLGSQSRLVVTDETGEDVWEGYVSDPGAHDDADGDGLRLAAVGGMVRAQDVVAPLVYLDAEMSSWEPASAMPTSGRADVGPIDEPGFTPDAPVMQFGFQSGYPIDTGTTAGFDYRQLLGSPQDVGGLVVDFRCAVNDGYAVDVLAINASNAATLLSTTPASTATTTLTLTAVPAGTKSLRLQLRRTGPATNVFGELAVCRATRVVLIGARVDRFGAPATDAATDLTSADIIEDLIGRGVLADVDPSAVQIDDSAAVYTQLAFPEGVRGVGVLDKLRESDPAMVWAYGPRVKPAPGQPVAGFRFSWHRWPTTGRYDLEPGPDGDAINRPGGEDESCQRITVYYKDAATGQRTSIVAVVADLAATARIRDADPLVIEEPTTATDALARGNTALAEVANRAAAGTAVVTRRLRDRDTGIELHPHELRPGYCATIVGTGEVVRITGVEWSSSDGDVASLSIGEPTATLESRMLAVISGDLQPGAPLIPLPPNRGAPTAPVDSPLVELSSDGFAPPVVTAPRTTGGIRSVVVSWDPVINRDLVTYHVHGSTDPDFEPTPTTHLTEATATTRATALAVWDPASDALVDCVVDGVYYFCVVAEDPDGFADPSPTVPGTPIQVNHEDIAVNAVTADQIDSNAVRTRHLESEAVTAEKIRARDITADRLSVGTRAVSVVVNGGMEDPWITPAGDKLTRPAAWQAAFEGTTPAQYGFSSAAAALAGTRSLEIAVPSEWAATVINALGDWYPVAGGEQWYVRLQFQTSHTYVGGKGVGLRFHTSTPGSAPSNVFDPDSTWQLVDSRPNAVGGTTYTLQGTVTVPAGHTKMAVGFYYDANFDFVLASAATRSTPRLLTTATRTAFTGLVGTAVTVTMDVRTLTAPASLRVHPYQESGLSIADTFLTDATTAWKTVSFKTTVKNWTDKPGLSLGEIGIYDDANTGGGIEVRNFGIALSTWHLRVDSVEAYPATGDNQITEIGAGKIRTGVLQAGQRVIAGTTAGARVELSSDGLGAWNAAGTKTFEVRASDGAVTSRGTFTTLAGASQGRVEISSMPNPWQAGQTWATLAFYSQNAAYDPALIWSVYQQGNPNWGELDLVGPKLGSRSAARIRLRSEEQTNQTYMLLEANRFQATADVYTWGDPVSGVVRFQLAFAGFDAQYGFQFANPGGKRVVFNYNTQGFTSVDAIGEDNVLNNLQLNANQIYLKIAGGQFLVIDKSRDGSGIVSIQNHANDTSLQFNSGILRAKYSSATSAHIAMGASAFTVNSDAADKTEVRRARDTDRRTSRAPGTTLEQMRRIDVFDYKTPHGIARIAGKRPPRGLHQQRGLMAQDVAAVWPDAVTEDEQGGLSVDLYYVLSTLWAAVQELADQVSPNPQPPS